MAKHRSWHGADIKRARKKKLKAEKKKKQILQLEKIETAHQICWAVFCNFDTKTTRYTRDFSWYPAQESNLQPLVPETNALSS